MAKQLIVPVGGTPVLQDMSPDDQAAFDAADAVLAQQRASRESDLAAIAFDPNDSATDLAKARAYVQATNAFLGEASHTVSSVAAQTERNSRVLRAILKQLIGTR